MRTFPSLSATARGGELRASAPGKDGSTFPVVRKIGVALRALVNSPLRGFDGCGVALLTLS